MAWLAESLESAEQRLARLMAERDQMERLAAESAARVDELAESLRDRPRIGLLLVQTQSLLKMLDGLLNLTRARII